MGAEVDEPVLVGRYRALDLVIADAIVWTEDVARRRAGHERCKAAPGVPYSVLPMIKVIGARGCRVSSPRRDDHEAKRPQRRCTRSRMRIQYSPPASPN